MLTSLRLFRKQKSHKPARSNSFRWKNYISIRMNRRKNRAITSNGLWSLCAHNVDLCGDRTNSVALRFDRTWEVVTSYAAQWFSF